ncbi:MAG: DUF4388 domain-containing protein [Myxococcota bacterium]
MPDVLRGELGAIRIASLLQFAEMDRLTGRLSVGEDGVVHLYDGHPVAASHGALSGVDALLAMLPLESGAFLLNDDAPVESGEPLCALMALIMGGARLQDEWSRTAPMVLGGNPERGWSPSDPFEAAIVERLDGERTLAEAVAGVAHPFVVLDGLLDAMERQDLIAVAPPNPERAAAALKPPSADEFYPLIDEARQRRKVGDLGGAESALRRALMIRPDDRTLQQNLRRIRQLREQA